MIKKLKVLMWEIQSIVAYKFREIKQYKQDNL